MHRPPVWQMVKAVVEELGGRASYSEIKQRLWEHYPGTNSSTITCQTIACSVNSPSRVHYPENKVPRIANGPYDFLYWTGRGRVELYSPEKHGIWEVAKTEEGDLCVRQCQDGIEYPAAEQVASSVTEQDGAFAFESHLRDYLAKNLPNLDGAGSLSLFVSDDGRDGVEFQTDVGPIDILAKANNGDLYVFELKLGRGPDAALGQILRYMGWIKEHVAGDRGVYGVIVASDISTKLKYAATVVPSVSLMEYRLQIAMQPVALQR